MNAVLLPDPGPRPAPPRIARVLTDAALLVLLGELCAFALIFPVAMPAARCPPSHVAGRAARPS